jgi:hypothetical protein
MSLTKASFSMITGAAFNVADYGAVADGVTDDTAAVNAAILAAYKSKAVALSPTDNIYQVEVRFVAGQDYKIVGPILVPSGINLNGNGCRLIGSYPNAVNTNYTDSAPSIIESAYYNGSAIVSNRAATVNVQRVTGSTIQNFSFLNANCAINAINMNENCIIARCSYNNVSAAMRLTCCFYIDIYEHMIRNSSQATNQYAILLFGNVTTPVPSTNSQLSIRKVFISGAVAGIAINTTGTGGVVINNCSFEDAYVTAGNGNVNGVGIYFQAGFAQGYSITNNYFEGIQTGIRFVDAGAYGISINDNYFSNTLYAIISDNASNLRVANFTGNAIIDGGGIIRNLVNFSPIGNDVFYQVASKTGSLSSGPSAFIPTFSPSNLSTAVATSVWVDGSSNLIAKSDPGLLNQNGINSFAYEGAQSITTANNVPFCTYAFTTDTLTILTSLTYDTSNIIAFNLKGASTFGSFVLNGFIFGNVVSWVTQTPGTASIAVNNSSGVVQLVITMTGTTTSGYVSGIIRHV